MVPVLKTFWKHHKSKELHFLHKSYIQKKSNSEKKIFFFDIGFFSEILLDPKFFQVIIEIGMVRS